MRRGRRARTPVPFGDGHRATRRRLMEEFSREGAYERTVSLPRDRTVTGAYARAQRRRRRRLGLAAALVGAVLAFAAGFALATVLDDPSPTAPETTIDAALSVVTVTETAAVETVTVLG